VCAQLWSALGAAFGNVGGFPTTSVENGCIYRALLVKIAVYREELQNK
jgi:hypothetical protein